MKYNIENLNAYVESGLAKKAKHPTMDLLAYNYSELAQYSGALKSDPLLQELRGLIVDFNGVAYARGFRKFFNLGECPDVDAKYAGKLPSRVADKMDGSLGIAYGPTAIATRGSFVSEQSQWASSAVASNPEYLDWMRRWFGEDRWCTPCFEIIYPENRIVVSYDFADLVFLGFVNKDTGKPVEIDFEPWPGRIVQRFPAKAPDELKAEDVANREGYVLAYDDGHMVKVKFDTYMRLHKIMTNFTPKNVLEHLVAGTLDQAIELCPDEFQDEVRAQAGMFEALHRTHVCAIKSRFNASKHLLEKSRKDFALAVKDSRYAHALFGLANGKVTVEDAAWEAVMDDFASDRMKTPRSP